MKRTFKVIGLIVVVAYLLIQFVFIHEYRFFKEEYLIKRNYKQNIEYFESVKNDFSKFPDIDINFGKNSFLDLRISRDSINKTKEKTNILWGAEFSFDEKIPSITIYDTIAYYSKDYYQYIIENLQINDSSIVINTGDSIFNIGGEWTLNYFGYQKSKFMKVVFELADLNTKEIELIKSKLRRLNCFGYEKANNLIILNYRATSNFFLDAYSYAIFYDVSDTTNFINELYTVHEKISDGVYWFHYEKLHMSYTPYLKLYNRDI